MTDGIVELDTRQKGQELRQQALALLTQLRLQGVALEANLRDGASAEDVVERVDGLMTSAQLLMSVWGLLAFVEEAGK